MRSCDEVRAKPAVMAQCRLFMASALPNGRQGFLFPSHGNVTDNLFSRFDRKDIRHGEASARILGQSDSMGEGEIEHGRLS